MSGGHFEYNCFKISEFAGQLRGELGLNVTDEQRAYLQKCLNVIELAGQLAYRIEWMYSCDIGYDTCKEECDKAFARFGLESVDIIDKEQKTK